MKNNKKRIIGILFLVALIFNIILMNSSIFSVKAKTTKEIWVEEYMKNNPKATRVQAEKAYDETQKTQVSELQKKNPSMTKKQAYNTWNASNSETAVNNRNNQQSNKNNTNSNPLTVEKVKEMFPYMTDDAARIYVENNKKANNITTITEQMLIAGNYIRTEGSVLSKEYKDRLVEAAANEKDPKVVEEVINIMRIANLYDYNAGKYVYDHKYGIDEALEDESQVLYYVDVYTSDMLAKIFKEIDEKGLGINWSKEGKAQEVLKEAMSELKFGDYETYEDFAKYQEYLVAKINMLHNYNTSLVRSGCEL